MNIHELNNFTGTLGSGAYLAIDDGTDTGKISSQGLLAATEARIDNIIAGPAPSAEEIVDARLGDDGVTYPSLGDAIRDQFSDLKSDLDDIAVFPINLYNYETIEQGWKVINLSTGAVETDGSNTYVVSDYIAVEAGRTYVAKYAYGYYGGSYKVPLYDSDKTFVSALTPITTNTTQRTAVFQPTQSGYVRLVLSRWDASADYYMTAMMVQGGSYPNSYSPYDGTDILLNPNLEIDDNVATSVENIGLSSKKTSWDALELTINSYFYNVPLNNPQDPTGYSVKKAGIAEGEKYQIKSSAGADIRAYVVLDADGNVTRVQSQESWGTNHNYDIEITILPSEDGGTIIANSITSSYVGLKQYVVTWEISGEQIKDNTLPLSKLQLVPSPNYLSGKEIICDGDSICASSTDVSGKGAYVGRIASNNNMTYTNYGVGGGTITNDTYIGEGTSNPRHWVCANVDTMYAQHPDADYIIFEGGTNDADVIGSIIDGTIPAKFGTYNPDKNYTGPFDPTTFCGAIETLFQKAITYWCGKKIGFVIAMKMGKTEYSGYKKENKNRRAYFEAIMVLCDKWGIPYINLWDECYMNPSLTACYNPSLDDQGNIDAGSLYLDGQHPTPKGYDYITPMIEAWIRTL